MKLEGERIFLTPLSEKELSSNYTHWLNDKDVCKYNSHGEKEYTYDDAVNFIKALANDKTKEVYAVYISETGTHIGNISLQSIDKKNNSAEVAILFGEIPYWNKGFAKEAMILLIKRAQSLNLHRLHFGTHKENIAMQKLGEKSGFLKEGTLKDAQFKNGKYNDVFVYGLIIGENK